MQRGGEEMRSPITRRQVFFVPGYDPQGTKGFHRMFRREWERFRTTWPVTSHLGDLERDSGTVAHCDIETCGPNWRVNTRYEYLRLGGLIRANLAVPMVRQLLRTARWMMDDLSTRTLPRTFRASLKIGVLISYSQAVFVTWLASAAAGGALVATAIGGPIAVKLAVGGAAAFATFLGLKPIVDRMFVNQLNNCWPHLREFAHSQPSAFDAPVETLARRVVTAARAGVADEIIIVGHSAGAMLGLAITARALELDPDLGRRGPRVILMTVGSLIPACALHPAARRVRSDIRRLAIERTLLWIDCQAQEDFMNFWNFDPVAGSGVSLHGACFNPQRVPVPFREMISPAFYARARWDFFRMHLQYIMANDRRAAYDYFMLVCGPAWAADWAVSGHQTMQRFSHDASYAASDVSHQTTDVSETETAA